MVEYRLGLIVKIGVERVEWLEGEHAPKKYTAAEAAEIKGHYRKLCREIDADDAMDERA
jgi:hypothetical protein